jgi:hypothetical protein
MDLMEVDCDGVKLGWTDSGHGPVAEFCECGDELPGLVLMEFL